MCKWREKLGERKKERKICLTWNDRRRFSADDDLFSLNDKKRFNAVVVVVLVVVGRLRVKRSFS